MKFKALAIAVSTVWSLTFSVCSVAVESPGFFIGANVGEGRFDHDSLRGSDNGFEGVVGYRWVMVPSLLLGIETGYADPGRIVPTVCYPCGPNTRIDGWNVGANAHMSINERWYVSGRLGRYQANFTVTADLSPYLGRHTSDRWYGGIGIGRNVGNNLSIGVEYAYFDAGIADQRFDSRLASVNVEYHF